ncbi:TPA: thioredoxin-disulfide reductase [Candidatus Dependentiae bacterium]|nr:thioredoxin-disulfide reductase [Candidatus Dependentiae bacterium]
MSREYVTIIGSGPAGLTAALYCARMGLSPLVIEGPLPGGQLMTTFLVENWPGEQSILGPSLIFKMREQAQHFGTRFASGLVNNINTKQCPFRITLADGKEILSESIIIASGARPRRLECPGEEAYWGKGVSSCAVCDGAFFKDKTVMVVGGGNSALEQILFVSKFAKKLILIHRSTELSATEKYLIDGIKQLSNLQLIFSAELVEIVGNQTQATGATIHHTKTNTKETLPVDGIFIAIGSRPNTNFIPEEVNKSAHGQIITTSGSKTNIPGIFGAGDVTTQAYRQAVTASAQGCQAALDVQKYLKKTGILLN